MKIWNYFENISKHGEITQMKISVLLIIEIYKNCFNV